MGQISIGGGISIGAGIILDGGPPPPPPVNTILPAITGTAQSGYTLGVSTGTWDNNPTGYTYQWQHGTTNIPGATSSTYTLDATYAGETIRCVVTATNAVGSVSATSAATAAVVAYPVNTVLPAISGNTAVGSTLTVSTGTWNNSPTGYTYQWQHGTTDISGATSSTYVIYGGYAGETLRCVVTATNAIGSNSATSASTSAVMGGPFLMAAAVISGTARNGQTLSVSTGTWAGTTPITYTYQWAHSGTNISGATSSTYTLDATYVGETINCNVTATNIVSSATYNAGPTATVAPLAPSNTSVPTISGTQNVGSTLTTTNGIWNNTPSSYTYQWKRSGTNISGATSSTYTLVSADQSATITCAVTATNVTGSATATSAATGSIGAQYGQQAYTSAGTYTWTAPAGVTKVSVVAVGGGASGGYGSGPVNNYPGGGGGGGGGLGYKNNITVVPGNTYTVVVGAGGQRQIYYSSSTASQAAGATPRNGYSGGDSYFIDATTVKGGGGAGPITAGSGAGGGYVGDGGGAGGTGKDPGGNSFTGGGGGGAGGYTGAGGDGGNNSTVATAGSGGGGAGGNSYSTWGGAGGGGVGLLGTGSNGAVSGTVSNGNTAGGGGGSGGSAGTKGDRGYPGGTYDGQWQVGGGGGGYGGGGGGAITEYGGEASGAGNGGAVRIIWDYTATGTRAFPSTLTTDL